MKLTATRCQKFQNKIWNYYRTQGRDFIWRKKISPYNVVVSEIMLQQTQTSRVAEKFPAFIKQFPNFKALAQATTPELLQAWQGLGYNRRALYLCELAKTIVTTYKNKLPNNSAELISLPGIGPNTAGSIRAFAFDEPSIFIETNIRAVFLHEFFPGQVEIPDTALLPLIESTLPTTNYREWYWALMDYGVHLKKTQPNPSRASKHHTKQSNFKGSTREIRGKIIQQLTQKPHTLAEIKKIIVLVNPQKLAATEEILATLITEEFITKFQRHYKLK